MPIIKNQNINLKFSELNTSIVGNTSTSKLSMSSILNNPNISYLVGVYPPKSNTTVKLSDFYFTNTGNLAAPKLYGTSNSYTTYQFGFVNAISADGSTLAFANGNDGPFGSVTIYNKVGSNWVFESKVQVPEENFIFTNNIQSIGNGGSVTLSGDGNTMAVGGSWDNGYYGALFIFTRSNSIWTFQQKLTPTGAIGTNLYFGQDSAISSDGSTIFVSSAYDNSNQGAVYVFTKTGSTWTQQQKITTSDGLGTSPLFGRRLKLSADNQTLLAASEYDNTNVGAVWIYVKSGSTWTKQQKIVDSTNPMFASDVAISSDGNTFAAASLINSPVGAGVAIYTRTGSTWSFNSRFTPSSISGDFSGRIYPKISMSGDGTKLSFSNYSNNSYFGAVWLFAKVSGTWAERASYFGPTSSSQVGVDNKFYPDGSGLLATQTGNPLIFNTSNNTLPTPTIFDVTPYLPKFGEQGHSVSTSADGKTIIVGASNETNAAGYSVGCAYIFKDSGSGYVEQAKLQASDAHTAPGVTGFSVPYGGMGCAISKDGKTAVVGYPGQASPDNLSNLGAAYVYTYDGTTWTQSAKLQVSGFSNGGNSQNYCGLGIDCKMSYDGTTIAITANETINGNGAVYIFTGSGSTWTQQARVQGTPQGSGSNQQYCDLSADGNTLIVSASGETPSGAAYVFTRSGSTWSQQARITPTTNSFRNSVALSYDGNTAVISGSNAIHIYNRSGTTWTLKTTIAGPANEQFGTSVAISADGNVLYTSDPLARQYYGGNSAYNFAGTVYVYTKDSSNNWNFVYTTNIPKTINYNGQLGSDPKSVRVSTSGKYVVAGAYIDNHQAGAAYVLT